MMTMLQVDEFMLQIDRSITVLSREMRDLRGFVRVLESNAAEGSPIGQDDLEAIGTRLAGFCSRLECLNGETDESASITGPMLVAVSVPN